MENREFFKKIAFQTPISISLVISFLGLYFGAFLGHMWMIVLGLMLGIALTLASHFLHSTRRKEFLLEDFLSVALLVGIYGIMAISLGIFSVRKFISAGVSAPIVVTALTALIFLALFVFELLYLKPIPKPEWDKKKSLMLLPIVGLAFAVIILNLENFNAWIRWDSYDYYYYFENLSYSSLNVFDNLRPANHAAYGCSIIYMVVNGIIGNTKVSLLLINILMLVVGTLLFHRITVKLFPHWHWYSHLATSCIYAFSPFIFGLSWSINLEAYLIFGLVLFFWGEIEKLPIIQTFAAVLICFSKETGAIILATVMIARLATNFIIKSKRKNSFINKLELGLSVPVLTVGLVWFYDFLENSWVSSNNLEIDTSIKDVAFNEFGFNEIYVNDRFTSLLFTNFTWLILVVVLAGFAIGLIRWKACSDERTYLLVELVAGLAVSLVPLFYFITYNHIRYAAPSAILLLLLLPEALDRMLSGCRVRTALCGILAACSLAQCYITVDPMMYSHFNMLNKGQSKLAISDNNILADEEENVFSISVDAQYNREIMYFDEALDEILEAINYDDKTCLLISGEHVKPSIGQYVGAEYLILGFGYPYMAKPRYICWDADKGERYLGTNKSDQINVAYVGQNHDFEMALEKYDRCILISFSFSNEDRFNSLLNDFNHERIAQKTTKGWTIYADKVTERPSEQSN